MVNRRIACLVIGMIVQPSCSERTFSRGIGRPSVPGYGNAEVPVGLPLRIRRVYASGQEGLSSDFAVITHDGAEALALEGAEVSLFLCDRLCSADDPRVHLLPDTFEPKTETLEPQSRYLTAEGKLAALGLSPNAGELAVVDDAGNVYAYVAWGADPGTLSSALHARAVLEGAVGVGSYVPLPYPLPTNVAVSVEEDTGCSAVAGTYGDNANAEPVDPSLCPAPAATPLQLNEILPALDGEATSWVEIRNTTDTDLSLFGVRLCAVPECVLFPRNAAKAPANALFRVRLGGEDDEKDLIRLSDGPLMPEAGEVALLAPGDATVSSVAQVLSFVRYGSLQGHSSLAEIAATEGAQRRWSAVDDAAEAPRIVNESLSRDIDGGDSSEGWNPVALNTPKIGTSPEDDPSLENFDVGRDNDDSTFGTWQSCSVPAPFLRASPPMLRVTRIARGEPPSVDTANVDMSDPPDVPTEGWHEIEIANVRSDGLPVRLSGWTLQLGEATYELGHAVPAPGAFDSAETPLTADDIVLKLLFPKTRLVITLIPDDNPTDAFDPCEVLPRRCWPDANADILESGTLTLLQNNEPRQFIHWGPVESAPDAALRAIETGVWPGKACDICNPPSSDAEVASSCFAGPLSIKAELRLKAGRDGQSPADYVHLQRGSDAQD